MSWMSNRSSTIACGYGCRSIEELVSVSLSVSGIDNRLFIPQLVSVMLGAWRIRHLQYKTKIRSQRFWRVPLCRNPLLSVATERAPPKHKSSCSGQSLRRSFLAQLYMKEDLRIKTGGLAPAAGPCSPASSRHGPASPGACFLRPCRDAPFSVLAAAFCGKMRRKRVVV